jgi:hypothetical protein
MTIDETTSAMMIDTGMATSTRLHASAAMRPHLRALSAVC